MSDIDELEEAVPNISIRVNIDSIDSAGKEAQSANGRKAIRRMVKKQPKWVYDDSLAKVDPKRVPSLPKLKFMGEK